MRKLNLIIKEEARNDIKQAFNWYENKQLELGERFINTINEYFSFITSNPKSFPVIFDNMRKAVIKTFPFIIVFEIESEIIVVYAVFNTNLNPDRLHKRK